MTPHDIQRALEVWFDLDNDPKPIVVYDHYGKKFICRLNENKQFDLYYKLNFGIFEFYTTDGAYDFIVSLQYMEAMLKNAKK